MRQLVNEIRRSPAHSWGTSQTVCLQDFPFAYRSGNRCGCAGGEPGPTRHIKYRVTRADGRVDQCLHERRHNPCSPVGSRSACARATLNSDLASCSLSPWVSSTSPLLPRKPSCCSSSPAGRQILEMKRPQPDGSQSDRQAVPNVPPTRLATRFPSTAMGPNCCAVRLRRLRIPWRDYRAPPRWSVSGPLWLIAGSRLGITRLANVDLRESVGQSV